MGMINTIQERLRIPALLLAAFSLIALAGCGTESPLGTVITVTADGGPIYSNLTSTTSASKTQKYIVSLADANNLPLNDIEVNLIGQFTNGQSISFGGSAPGSVPIPVVPGAPVSVTLSATQKTGDFGYLVLAITAPYYSIIPLHVPYNQTGTGQSTGGQLPDGTYSYTITALDILGETEATTPFTAVVTGATISGVSTGSVALSWQAVPGATGYRIYGRTIGSESAMLDLLNASGDPVTFVDNGSPTPSGTPPPGANSTGLSLNTVVGNGQASSGSSFKTFTINF